MEKLFLFNNWNFEMVNYSRTKLQYKIYFHKATVTQQIEYCIEAHDNFVVGDY